MEISRWCGVGLGAANDIVSCMKNGLTLEMPDPKGFHTDVLKEAYKDGRITDQELDNWTKNVLQKFCITS